MNFYRRFVFLFALIVLANNGLPGVFENCPLHAKEKVADEKKQSDTDEKSVVEASSKDTTTPRRSDFPDAGLQNAVRYQVFPKRRTKEPVFAEEVAKISRVEGVQAKIKSLEGLQHALELRLADFRKNNISNLGPLTNLNLIQSLMLSENQITDISPLAGLSSMQLLDLAANQVTDLSPIEGMENLRTLYVNDNPITSLDPLKPLSKIWSLDVSGTRVTDLKPIANLSWLSSLNLRNTPVTDLTPLGQLRQLRLVQIGNNPLTDLTPLIEACRDDSKGERRFAPYLRLFVGPLPKMDDATRKSQIETLLSLGVRVEQVE